MVRCLALIPFVACIGCSSTSLPYCGEAFCLTEPPTKVSKQTPVEDFNVYRIEYGSKRLHIYEGNHPDTSELKPGAELTSELLPPGFIEGRFFEDTQSYQLVLRTPYTDWPKYVVLSTAHDPKEMDRLSSLLRGKLPTKASPSS